MPTTPLRAAAWFTVLSMVLGPGATVLGAALFTRGGGDYCDGGAYGRPDGSWDPSRDVEFFHAYVFAVSLAAAMLLVGAGVLTWLVARRDALGRVPAGLAGAVVALVVLGWVAVLLLARPMSGTC